MTDFSKLCGLAALAFGLTVAPTLAQNFTTAAEVRPILTATKPSWIAVRAYEGQDLLYFTNALAWRCALTEIRYGVNGAPPDTVLAMEPCYDSEAVPNALKMDGPVLPYVTLPLNSVDTVSVLLTFDDGSTEAGSYLRAAVLTP